MNRYKLALFILLLLPFGTMLQAQEDAPGRIPQYPVPYEFPTVDGTCEGTTFAHDNTYYYYRTFHFRLKSEWPED